MIKSEGPKIITEESEAIAEFRKLTEYGFTVHQMGRVLTELEFVTACEEGQPVWVKGARSAGEVVNTEIETFANLHENVDHHLVYTVLTDNNFVPYEPGLVLDEAAFVGIAAKKEGVVLVRRRSNGDTLRTFGTVIGSSQSTGTRLQ